MGVPSLTHEAAVRLWGALMAEGSGRAIAAAFDLAEWLDDDEQIAEHRENPGVEYAERQAQYRAEAAAFLRQWADALDNRSAE